MGLKGEDRVAKTNKTFQLSVQRSPKFTRTAILDKSMGAIETRKKCRPPLIIHAKSGGVHRPCKTLDFNRNTNKIK